MVSCSSHSSFYYALPQSLLIVINLFLRPRPEEGLPGRLTYGCADKFIQKNGQRGWHYRRIGADVPQRLHTTQRKPACHHSWLCLASSWRVGMAGPKKQQTFSPFSLGFNQILLPNMVHLYPSHPFLAAFIKSAIMSSLTIGR
jgi:hypothetical protein